VLAISALSYTVFILWCLQPKQLVSLLSAIMVVVVSELLLLWIQVFETSLQTNASANLKLTSAPIEHNDVGLAKSNYIQHRVKQSSDCMLEANRIRDSDSLNPGI